MLSRFQSDPALLAKIGSKVRHYRKRLQLSVHDLSSISDVPVEVICALEMQAVKDMDLLTIANLTEALMINLLWSDSDETDECRPSRAE